MPGIMGRSEGKRQVSAGVEVSGDRNTASTPMVRAAINVAAMIWRPAPKLSFMSQKRSACPIAAMRAHTGITLNGGRLMAEKPIAAIAASNASSKILVHILK